MIFTPDRFRTASLRDPTLGDKICQILSAAMNQADAEVGIKNNISRDADWLIFPNERIKLSNYKRIFLLGAGKAVVPMTHAINNILGKAITAGAIITKDGYLDQTLYPIPGYIRLLKAGHPIPDQRNLRASSSILALAQNLQRDDLIICLISGGGSSLLVKPSSGLSLHDIGAVTSLLLSCGASIDEINTIRKHLDDFKGGGLVRLFHPATVISLILSDVIGDRLDMVASGPTVADPTTFKEAWAILQKSGLSIRFPTPFRLISKMGRLVCCRKP
jgi:glycerate 2-kinase